MFDDFETVDVAVEDTTIHVRRGGTGPAVLLLHGFPQTHLMWRDIAPILARRFTVVCADLTGYGRSGCPPAGPDHGRYAKRAMAKDMAAVMSALGFAQFAVAGHDRGGRVAYRLALDLPERILHVAILDVIAIADAWDRADRRLAVGYWPWSLLAQAAPFPEQLILGRPDALVDQALSGWGSAPGTFSADVRAEYIDVLRDPNHVHAICEEYRAAASVDYDHDVADRKAGRRIACPLLAHWSKAGPLNHWYAEAGGPLALWRAWAADVRGGPVEGGHFFPEELPRETAEALIAFFSVG